MTRRRARTGDHRIRPDGLGTRRGSGQPAVRYDRQRRRAPHQHRQGRESVPRHQRPARATLLFAPRPDRSPRSFVIRPAASIARWQSGEMFSLGRAARRRGHDSDIRDAGRWHLGRHPMAGILRLRGEVVTRPGTARRLRPGAGRGLHCGGGRSHHQPECALRWRAVMTGEPTSSADTGPTLTSVTIPRPATCGRPCRVSRCIRRRFSSGRFDQRRIAGFDENTSDGAVRRRQWPRIDAATPRRSAWVC